MSGKKRVGKNKNAAREPAGARKKGKPDKLKDSADLSELDLELEQKYEPKVLPIPIFHVHANSRGAYNFKSCAKDHVKVPLGAPLGDVQQLAMEHHIKIKPECESVVSVSDCFLLQGANKSVVVLNEENLEMHWEKPDKLMLGVKCGESKGQSKENVDPAPKKQKDVDDPTIILAQLISKHKNAYSSSLLNVWAQKIAAGTYASYDIPPDVAAAVPAPYGVPLKPASSQPDIRLPSRSAPARDAPTRTVVVSVAFPPSLRAGTGCAVVVPPATTVGGIIKQAMPRAKLPEDDHCHFGIRGADDASDLPPETAVNTLPIHDNRVELTLVEHTTTLELTGEAEVFPLIIPDREWMKMTVSAFYQLVKTRMPNVDSINVGKRGALSVSHDGATLAAAYGTSFVVKLHAVENLPKAPEPHAAKAEPVAAPAVVSQPKSVSPVLPADPAALIAAFYSFLSSQPAALDRTHN